MPVRSIGIVGGGLAGCITGLELLAGRHAGDYRVTVYEREDAPYTTLCGEGLSQATLQRFTAFDSTPFIAEEFVGASWAWPGGVRVLVDHRCYTMARERWIPAMADELKRLGATYRTGVKVGAADVARLAEEHDLVVGADGPGSQARRHVGGEHTTTLGIQYRVDRSAYDTDRLEFFTDKRWTPEYAWIFPRGDMHNVGILADPALPMDENWRRLDAFMEHMGVAGKVLKREAYPIGFSGTRLMRGNVALVGDAAGLTNPVTKGGMAAVIYAAEMLARCAKEDRLADYEHLVREHAISSPLYQKAVDFIKRTPNEEFERLTRFSPPTMRVGPGESGRRKYALPLLMTMLANPRKVRDLNVLVRAMGLSLLYSW